MDEYELAQKRKYDAATRARRQQDLENIRAHARDLQLKFFTAIRQQAEDCLRTALRDAVENSLMDDGVKLKSPPLRRPTD